MKTGVYICKGCGIGECLKTETLVEIANKEFHVPIVRTSPAFCLEDVEIIKKDIAGEGITHAVIAACSPRVNTDVFRLKPTVVQRVNLREQVVWSHPPNTDETQSLADDYLRMGLIQAQKTLVPTPHAELRERTVLVVGGGMTGLAAALGAADAGYNVLLVEKQPHLGGFALKLHKHFPSRPPYDALAELSVRNTVQEVENHPNITVFLSTIVAQIEGQPGDFHITLSQNGSTQTAKAGAVVLATGFRPYNASKFVNYGFGRCANVVTNVALEEMASNRKVVRPSDGRVPRHIAILQCESGSDEQHLPYSGNVTSLVTLKQASYLRQLDPASCVYVIYQDMQTPGQYEYFYRSVQKDSGVFFSQGEVLSVSEDENGDLVLDLDKTLLGGRIQLKVDLLVLATGLAPATIDAETMAGLNLKYLQGSELPRTNFGFVDSNFICFPYETRRTGIYSAGCVRQPMDVPGCVQDGLAAALKAIQCIEKSSAGAAVHPRVGDLSLPLFFMQKCTACGRCSQECPFGALELDEKKNPVLDPNRCRRCGICMGACPVQIISFDDYSVDMLSSMIRAVEIPEGDDDKLRILVLACDNDAYPALDMAGINRLSYSANFRVLPVRCLGSVNSVLIADAVSRGFDGVALMGCKSGEDYQCHFIQGSELLGRRMENVRETLNRLALEPERVQVHEVAISDYARVPGLLDAFLNTVRKLGPNPFKGF